MKCEHCGKNEATFFVRSSINGRVQQVHLCQDCAAALGYTDRLRQEFRPSRFFSDDFFMRPLGMLEPFFGDMGMRMLTEFPEPVEVTEQARIAVANEPESAGLVDGEEQKRLQLQCRRNALEARLKDAVAREDYESAAKLRDELKALPQTDL